MAGALTFQTFIADLGAAWGVRLTHTQPGAVLQIMRFIGEYGVSDPRQMAYLLATARHESDLKPDAVEKRAPANSPDPKMRELRAMQDKYWRLGYMGKGLPQLTRYENYVKFGRLLGIPLAKNPNLIKKVEVGAEVLVMGMAKGYFTKYKLSDFFTPACNADWLGARLTINGKPKGHVMAYHADIVAGSAMLILPVLEKYYPA